MTNMKFEIAGRKIGVDEEPYVIAEMSGNHNGELNRAFKILEEAKLAGADAVKLQTYRPDTITINHTGPEFTIGSGLWEGRRLHDLYQEAHTPWEWHEPIFDRAKQLGLTVFSSPFDRSAVDLLESLNAPAYKIASPEIVDLPLIKYVAQTRKPLIISTGMANLTEISEAVETARYSGASNVVLLQCTSAYPAPPEEANLATIPDLARRFGVLVGLSDHTIGYTASIIAVAFGASIIEKHFTLSRMQGGVDSGFSIEPKELAKMIARLREARLSVGSPAYNPTQSEKTVLANRRSIYVVAEIKKGEEFNDANIRSIRPANGLALRYYEQVIGRCATRDLIFGEPLQADMVSGNLI